MGCATALAIAERGAQAVVLERAVPGAEASSAAAGILGAQVEAHANAAILPLLARARTEYAAWSEALRARTGIDIGYRVTGGLRVATSEDDARELAPDAAWQRQHGLRVDLVDAQGAHEIEPELGAVVAGAHFPDESQVDPPSLLRALVTATCPQKRPS